METSHKVGRLAGRIGSILVATVLGASAAFAQAPAFQPQTGYWEVPNEPNGRSVVLETKANGEIYAAVMVYNEAGQPTWFVVNTNTDTANPLSGNMQRFVAGQNELDGSYSVNYFDGFKGLVTFNFDSPTTGTMTWPTGSVRIARTNFVPNGVGSGPQAGAPRGGWWWNASESGRGYFIEVQNDQMTFAAALYDALDQPVWFISRGAMLSPTVYSGEFLITYGGMTLDGAYKRPNEFWTRGNFTVQFTSDDTAVLTMPDGHQVPITRYTF